MSVSKRMSTPSPSQGRLLEDAGMVTAETAMAMPALVIVLLMCMFGISAGQQMLQCGDAARLSARAYARGDGVLSSQALARKVAPDGSRVSIRKSGDSVTVDVATTLKGPGFLKTLLPSMSIHQTATAPMELK